MAGRVKFIGPASSSCLISRRISQRIAEILRFIGFQMVAFAIWDFCNWRL